MPSRTSASGISTCPPRPNACGRRSTKHGRRPSCEGRPDRQRQGHLRGRGGPHAARALPARGGRPDRDERRLRHDLVRRLHGAAGRGVGQVVHGARRPGRRAPGHHAGGAGEQRGDAPGAARVPRAARPAVRVLHAGHGDGDRVAAAGEPAPHRGAGAGRPGRQPVPVHRLPQHRPGSAGRRLDRRRSVRVIPSSFSYRRAGSVEEAAGLAASYGEDAKYLAGGHSLLPLMKLRLATPEVLIDLGGLRDLSYITDQGTHVAIGALTRHHDIERSGLLGRQLPLLAHAAGRVGDPQIRHGGTASDLPAVLLALDATLVARGSDGSREIPVGEFFTGLFETALAPGELLTEIRVPKPARPAAWSFQKFTQRAIDWAIVGAAVQGGNVALVNMGPTPLRAAAVEAALAGGASPAEAAGHAAEGTSPSSDIRASSGYREHLARVLVARALAEANARSQ